MARRKSAADVGPLGNWAYDTRDRLDMSVEAVVAALPTTYNPATLRKVEGGSSKPGKRMWRELHDLYTRVGTDRGVTLDAQPALGEAAATSPDLAAAIRDQTAAINALVARLDLFVGPLGEVVADMLREQTREATDRRRSGAATS